MSSSSRALKLAGLALAVASALGGCSGLSPVYGTGHFTSERIVLAMAPPTNRTEQLIYEDLALRFGRAAGPAAKLSVSTSAGASQITSDQNVVVAPRRPVQLTLTAAVTLTDEAGKVLFSGVRAASADYENGPQIIGNTQAAADAAARAAHLLADTIRLTVLGALAR